MCQGKPCLTLVNVCLSSLSSAPLCSKSNELCFLSSAHLLRDILFQGSEKSHSLVRVWGHCLLPSQQSSEILLITYGTIGFFCCWCCLVSWFFSLQLCFTLPHLVFLSSMVPCHILFYSRPVVSLRCCLWYWSLKARDNLSTRFSMSACVLDEKQRAAICGEGWKCSLCPSSDIISSETQWEWTSVGCAMNISEKLQITLIKETTWTLQVSY